MATSGTVTFSVNEADIIETALQDIGYLDHDESASGTDIEIARRKLNMIVKQWTSQLDFAPGLKMWTRRRAYVFLQKSQVSYSLGPSGSHATETYVTTTLSASAASSASTVVLTSATGIASGDFIGVLMDSGTIHWTTVNGAPSGSTVTLTLALAGAATSGARVFAYTTKMRRPFEIATCVRHDTDGNDSPVDSSMTLEEYEQIPNKTSEGSPTRLYLEAQRTNAVAYIDCAPDNRTDVLRLVYLSYIEDFASETDDADFPAEWSRALIAQLAMDCCLPFGRPVPQALPGLLTESLAMARKAYVQTSTLSYESEPDEY